MSLHRLDVRRDSKRNVDALPLVGVGHIERKDGRSPVSIPSATRGTLERLWLIANDSEHVAALCGATWTSIRNGHVSMHGAALNLGRKSESRAAIDDLAIL